LIDQNTILHAKVVVYLLLDGDLNLKFSMAKEGKSERTKRLENFEVLDGLFVGDGMALWSPN